MSGNYIFPEDTLPTEPAVPSGLEKVLKRFIIAAGIILTAELIWLLAVSPCMPLSKVDVIGIPELDKAFVLAAAGIENKSSYLSVNARLAEQALKTLCQVGSAEVIKRFPDSVRIILEGRKAVALALVPIDGRLHPVFFDREGVVFKIGTGWPEPETVAAPLPIISGLAFDQPLLGTRLDPMFHKLFSAVEAIAFSAPELLAAISEIKINRKAYDGYDLTLYPAHFPVRVRLEAELQEDKLRYVLLMLDVIAVQENPVEEIDFRSSTASYTVKEVTPGY
ncbi:MAG: FtsQ-type POTRA domain-containing protein [Treponema sp.]|jgi:cell division protein FtsQ|nr:FtsQ-type POTRA domain-containing protein [Treponema sp.]